MNFARSFQLGFVITQNSRLKIVEGRREHFGLLERFRERTGQVAADSCCLFDLLKNLLYIKLISEKCTIWDVLIHHA
jgi:hypothetical protein